MHKPLSYLTKICKQFSSKATPATSNHEDHSVTTNANTSATTIAPSPITNCAATTSTSSSINSSYYSADLYITNNSHSHSSNGNNNNSNSCNSCNSNGSYIGSSSSFDPREYSNSNQGYSSTAQSLCYDQGASFETEFGYNSPAYSNHSNSNYHSNHCHNQVANLSYSNSNSAYGMLINNDRANSMESHNHSNSLPAGTAGAAYGVGAGGAVTSAECTDASAYDGAKYCNGAGAIIAAGAGAGVRAIKAEGELCSALEAHNNDSQTLASNHKLGTNNDCSTTLNDGSNLHNQHMAPALGAYQQDELGLPVEEGRSLNGSDRTLLNNCCDNHNQDHAQRAESDDNDSCTGVHSLGNTTFAYAKDKYGAITKVDTKATDEILSNKEDELNDIQKSTCSSGPFSPAQRAALQAQCPITQSSLWQQIVGQHGQAKLGSGEVMLPELDPMHAGNHSYQLIHSLYNIANEGYLRFDAVSEGELIRANQGEISTLLRRVDGSAEELNCYLIPLIKAMVRCCSIAPASMYHHHDDIGGLIRHNLQIANDCIEDYSNFAHAKVTVANTIASLTEQRKVKKQAEAAYLANIQKQAALENKVKSSYEKFQESLGLIDDELNDGLNTDLNLEVLNTTSSPDQKYADLAKTMGLMIDQSFADGPIESLASIFDDDQKQSTSNGTSTGAGADTNTATSNSASTATGVASNVIAGIAASGIAGAGDDNGTGSGNCDTTLALSQLKHVPNNSSSLFNGDQAIMDNWDSLNLLQRAKAFGLLTYVEDEQIAQLASAYSGSNTNSDVALGAGEDPYLVGLGANLIGATSTAEAYEKEMGNIKRSLFEDAFVKKICDLNLSQGSLNDYNSTVTKQRKDTFSGLINQIRMEAQNNNIGRFDRYQLDLIVQLSLIFFSFAHDLGKLIHDMEIFNDHGERYNPHLETLANFAEQTQTKYLYLRYITSRSKEEHSHTSSMFSGVRLLSSMCPDLVALIYQVFNLDAVLANKSHPINLFVASHDRINSAQITKTSNMYLKNFAAQMVIELVKSRLRADALAQMQIARIQMLAQEQGIDLSSDFDLSPSGHNLNSAKAKAQAKSQATPTCDFDNLWQEITPKAPSMASTAAINKSSPSLSANSSLSSSNGSNEDNGSGQGSEHSCSKTNADQARQNYSQGMGLCNEQGTNANDSNSLATSLHLNNAQGPAHSLKPGLSEPNGNQILQELLDANKQDHSQDNHSPIHNSVRSFREQMKEDGSFAYSGNDSNALNGEHLYKFNAQKQNELLKNKRIKDLQKEQYHWAVRIFKSARRSLSVNELGSDLYVEGNTVLLEQGSRALSTLNLAYQNYCYGHLSEQFSSCKSDFKTHLQVQKLSETYMSNRDYSWFAIAVGDDLVIVKGIDLRLIGCDFGSDVAIINLGVNNPLIEELTLDLANYILYNIRQS